MHKEAFLGGQPWDAPRSLFVRGRGTWSFAAGNYDDEFQEKVADAIVEHEGGLVLGAGGTGKSEIIRRIKKKFEANRFRDPPFSRHPQGKTA